MEMALDIKLDIALVLFPMISDLKKVVVSGFLKPRRSILIRAFCDSSLSSYQRPNVCGSMLVESKHAQIAIHRNIKLSRPLPSCALCG